MDEAALGRLRQAIAAGDGDEEEQEQQLNGVLRMLGAEIPDKNQLPLFGMPPTAQAVRRAWRDDWKGRGGVESTRNDGRRKQRE